MSSDNSSKRGKKRGKPSKTDSAKKRGRKETQKKYYQKTKTRRITMLVSDDVADQFAEMKDDMNITTNEVGLKCLLEMYRKKQMSMGETLVEETSSSSGSTVMAYEPIPMPAKRVLQPMPEAQTKHMIAVSTPFKVPEQMAGSSSMTVLPSGMTIATTHRVTSSISSSSVDPLSGIESSDDQPSLGVSTLRSPQMTQQFEDSRFSMKSGTWDIDLLEELLDEEEEIQVHDDDPSYMPSFDTTASLDQDRMEEILENAGIELRPADDEDVVMHEREEELQVFEEEAEAGTEEDKPSPAAILVTEDNMAEVLEDETGLAYSSCLKQLALMESPTKCTLCQKPLGVKESQVGTSIYLKWICENGHVETRWCSQPRFKHGAHFGDFAVASSVLFSGSSYSKVAVFLTALNMKPVTRSTYYKIHSQYAVQAVDKLWGEVVNENINNCSGNDVVLIADGRMDSPGYSAEYCTYTTMDYSSKDILDITIVNKRETSLNSVIMEKEACRRSLDTLLAKGVNVTELATDAHTQIKAMLAKEAQYKEIFHSLDIWHASKNLGKKLAVVAMEKGGKPLLPWVRDIVNHFWYCAKKTNETEEFVEKWRGVLHHVQHKHEWLGHPTDENISGTILTCDHESIEVPREDKKWIEGHSTAHEKLATVVLDTRLLKNVPYFLRFRNTSMLETFNSIILAYATKRISYRPPGYRARCELAGLDYQANKDRQVKTRETGEVQLQRKWCKKSKTWSAYALKEKKEYGFIRNLMEISLLNRLQNPHLMRQKIPLADTDPRRIRPILADKPPLPSRDIYTQKVSRL